MIAIKLALLPRDTIIPLASTALILFSHVIKPITIYITLLQSLAIGLFVNLMSIVIFFMEIFKNHFSWLNLLALLILITKIIFVIFTKPFMALSKPFVPDSIAWIKNFRTLTFLYPMLILLFLYMPFFSTIFYFSWCGWCPRYRFLTYIHSISYATSLFHKIP